MREIKFRCWDRQNKVLRPVKYLRWLHNGKIASIGWGDEKGFQERLRPRDCELMQMTGLKDKNGKEIYEGDIVKAIGDPYKVCFGEWDNGSSWDDYEGGIGWYLDDNTEHGKSSLTSDVEVIGNIYENPELLK